MKKQVDILKYIFLTFATLSFFEIPYLIYKFPVLSVVYKICKSITLLFLMLLIIKRKKMDKSLIYLILFLSIMLISSIINKNSVVSSIFSVVEILGICALVDYEIKVKDDKFLNTVIFVLGIYFLINFISIIMYPTGIYINSTGYSKNWILGYKNAHIQYIFPLNLAFFMKSLIKKNKISISCYILLILSIISSILVNNSTAIIGLFLILAFSVFVNSNSRIINPKYMLLIPVILFFLIVIFRVQNIFGFIFVDLLDRDITLTGRIYIWDGVIKAISSRRIIGYGITPFVFITKSSLSIYSTHSLILDIVYRTGFLGVLVFILYLKESLKNVFKFKNNKIIKLIIVFLFSMGIMTLTEAYPYVYIFYLFVLCSDSIIFANGGVYHEN